MKSRVRWLVSLLVSCPAKPANERAPQHKVRAEGRTLAEHRLVSSVGLVAEDFFAVGT